MSEQSLTHLTPKEGWQERFLTALSQKPIIKRACKKAGISRETAYNYRESDPEFAAAWKAALENAVDGLVETAWDRATEESDTLTIFLLKAHRPEVYRETIRQETTGADGGPISITVEDARTEARRSLARLAAASAVGSVAELPEPEGS